MFLDGPEGKFRDAMHVIFAGEKVWDDYVAPAPDVTDAEPATEYRVISLMVLLTM